MSPTKNSDTSNKITPKHFERYGLRVPLVKLGQKRLHARSTDELTVKSKQGLSDIVKDYAANKGPKLIKSLASKTALAEWIERVETLALGPHPESKLPCKSDSHAYKINTDSVAATKKDDLVEALGLKTATPKAKGNNVGKDVPCKKSGQKKAASTTETRVTAQSIVSSLPKTTSFNSKAASIQQATPQSSPNSVIAQKQTSVEITAEPAGVARKANKRKHDSAAAPTEAEQTPLKKTKTVQAASPLATKSFQMSVATTSQDPVVRETFAPDPVPERASQGREAFLNLYNSPVQTAETQIHEEAQEEINLRPNSKKNPSMVIHWGKEDIVVTHAPLETYVYNTDYTSGAKTGDLETVNGGRLYTKKINRAIDFTFIPHGYDSDACLKCDEPETRFFKPGVHGRNGDFKRDPDLYTGRGHQVEPVDLNRKREYEAVYGKFHAAWPYWPYVDRERRYLASENVQGKSELDEAERWMVGYRDKYQGENVGHLWPCGCEKVMDGDESEEE